MLVAALVAILALANRTPAYSPDFLAEFVLYALSAADVTMVAGPTSLSTPAGVTRVDVRSTAEMADAVFARVADCHVFVAVAAAADYTPVDVRKEKIKKSGEIGRAHV